MRSFKVGIPFSIQTSYTKQNGDKENCHPTYYTAAMSCYRLTINARVRRVRVTIPVWVRYWRDCFAIWLVFFVPTARAKFKHYYLLPAPNLYLTVTSLSQTPHHQFTITRTSPSVSPLPESHRQLSPASRNTIETVVLVMVFIESFIIIILLASWIIVY